MARKVEARPVRKRKPAKTVAAKPRAVARAAQPKPRAAPRPRVPKVAPPPPPLASAAEDALAIEAFNRRYYDAFQTLSGDEMAKVWWHDDQCSCVHPGWDIRHGWPMVRSTYEEIFANTKSIRFALGDVCVRVLGDLGYVTCVENLVTEEQESGDFLGAVLATNVYERRRGDWKMIHHHASPFSSDDAEFPEGPLH